MTVRLTQLDGKLPNLALMKLSHYFQAQGGDVVLERSATRGLFEPQYDADSSLRWFQRWAIRRGYMKSGLDEYIAAQAGRGKAIQREELFA